MVESYSEHMLKLPPAQRGRFYNGRRKGRKREPKREFTREELIDYMYQRKIQTWRELESQRQPGEPATSDYRKEFGSWSNAKKAVWGFIPDYLAKANQETDEYFVKLLIQTNTWTKRDYLKGRRRNPSIFPSYSKLLSRWKRWAVLKETAKRHCAEIVINNYIRLARRLRRIPTVDECKAENIEIERAKAFLFKANKRMLDDYVFGFLLKAEADSWGTK